MTMNCSEAKHLIHLDVGDDLRADEEQKLASHMEQCSDCRMYHVGMSSALTALLTLRDDPSLVIAGKGVRSVWPSLSREIRRRRVSPRVARQFNVQVVALSVCSLLLAVVTMVQSLSSMRDYRDPTSFVPARTVSNQAHMTQPRWLDQTADRVSSPMLPLETPVSLPQSF